MPDTTDKVRENRARRWAKRLGCRLIRSRARLLHINNRGLYQLIDDRNIVIAGESFDCSLDDIEKELSVREGALARLRMV